MQNTFSMLDLFSHEEYIFHTDAKDYKDCYAAFDYAQIAFHALVCVIGIADIFNFFIIRVRKIKSVCVAPLCEGYSAGEGEAEAVASRFFLHSV